MYPSNQNFNIPHEQPQVIPRGNWHIGKMSQNAIQMLHHRSILGYQMPPSEGNLKSCHFLPSLSMWQPFKCSWSPVCWQVVIDSTVFIPLPFDCFIRSKSNIFIIIFKQFWILKKKQTLLNIAQGLCKPLLSSQLAKKPQYFPKKSCQTMSAMISSTHAKHWDMSNETEAMVKISHSLCKGIKFLHPL